MVFEAGAENPGVEVIRRLAMGFLARVRLQEVLFVECGIIALFFSVEKIGET